MDVKSMVYGTKNLNNMNWNSKTKQWTDLKSVTVIKMAKIARKLKSKRMSVKNIAEVLDRSESRVKEYLKSK